MNRREFIKKSALTTIGGLLIATPLGRVFAKGNNDLAIDENQTTEYESNKSNKNMKVLLINGSPHKQGNTFTALSEVAKTLELQGIEAEIVHIGVKAVRGCIACGQCHMNALGKCIFDDDVCNNIIDKLDSADGLVFGSPVYYGQPNGSLLSLMQRMCYAGGDKMQNKPAAAVCVCRRGGATAAFQTLTMPFQMMNMPVVTSQYWNIVYGMSPGQASLDTEGMQTMRTLANNMAWLLKKIHTGDPDYPEREAPKGMNFIR